MKQYGTLQHHGSIIEAKKLAKLTNYQKQKLQKYRTMAATISTQISSKTYKTNIKPHKTLAEPYMMYNHVHF